MRKISIILLAGALLGMHTACTKNTTNNYGVTPDSTNTTPVTPPPDSTTTKKPTSTLITTAPFTVIDSTWAWLVTWNANKKRNDTTDVVYFEQDDVRDRSATIVWMGILYSSDDSFHTMPDLYKGTTFSWTQKSDGFTITYSATGGYDPGDPGDETFELTVKIPAQKSGEKSTLKTIIVVHQKILPQLSFMRPTQSFSLRRQVTQ